MAGERFIEDPLKENIVTIVMVSMYNNTIL